MAHYAACPLCKSENIVQHMICRDHFLSKEEFPLSRCLHCGFIFTQDHPDEFNSGKYYESDDYVSHNDKSSGLLNSIYRIARELTLINKRKLIRKITGLKSGKLLDIGSGSGHFLRKMKIAGWITAGVEINEKARNFSASKFNLDIISPEMLSSQPAESYDCITLWHVLEHFHNPYSYTREIKRLLKPEGICVIALPNCRSFDASYYGTYWAAYDVPRHLWHFSPDTFRIFSEKTGFDLAGIRPLPLDVFYISALSEKYRGRKLSFITGILKGAWFSLLSILHKEKNSSLIYLLRKK